MNMVVVIGGPMIAAVLAAAGLVGATRMTSAAAEAQLASSSRLDPSQHGLKPEARRGAGNLQDSQGGNEQAHRRHGHQDRPLQ